MTATCIKVIYEATLTRFDKNGYKIDETTKQFLTEADAVKWMRDVSACPLRNKLRTQ